MVEGLQCGYIGAALAYGCGVALGHYRILFLVYEVISYFRGLQHLDVLLLF